MDIPTIPTPAPLNSIKPIIVDNIPFEQFSTSLFRSGASQYTPVPPSNKTDKGKVIAQSIDDCALKKIMPYIEEGGSTPNLSSVKHFRIVDEKKLKRLTSAQLKAQEQVLTEIETKRIQHINKSREEYIRYISFKDDPLPITKFNYRVSKTTKIATMRIVRNNQLMNYKIFDDFKHKMLGFTEWIELHSLASKRQNAINDQLLNNLKAKFKWVANTIDKLGILPPPQLTDFELPPAKRKRNRMAKIIKEVFVSEEIVVDGMHINLNLPHRITTGTAGQVIKEPEARIFLYNGNFDLIF
ncbi:hypothetical protein Tco_0251009 [Tanacetum coccineum]